MTWVVPILVGLGIIVLVVLIGCHYDPGYYEDNEEDR